MREFGLRSRRKIAGVAIAASAASALEFTVLSATDVSIGIGEEFAIDIALSNNNGQAVAGIWGTVEGADAFAIDSGESAVAHLTTVCLAPSTGCVEGVDTVPNFLPPPQRSVSGHVR